MPEMERGREEGRYPSEPGWHRPGAPQARRKSAGRVQELPGREHVVEEPIRRARLERSYEPFIPGQPLSPEEAVEFGQEKESDEKQEEKDDEVHFSAFLQPFLVPGQSVELHFWAFLLSQVSCTPLSKPWCLF